MISSHKKLLILSEIDEEENPHRLRIFMFFFFLFFLFLVLFLVTESPLESVFGVTFFTVCMRIWRKKKRVEKD